MWSLYFMMSLLAAGVVIKLVNPLMGRGRFRHGDTLTRADRSLAVMLMMIVPVLSLVLYLSAGRPDLKGYQAVFYDLEELNRRHMSLLAERPMTILLERDGSDLGALRTLGEIHTNLGNHAEAAKFYAHAVRSAIAKQDSFLRLYAVALGEAQIRTNGGKVGDDAVATFQFVLTLYPESPLARHYLVLRKRQDGDVQGAIDDWFILLNEGPTRSYWKTMVREALEEARRTQRQQ
jgi:cytochrome c-type biogenesis protein CcmH/NrfG